MLSIIAEISANHDGKLEYCKGLMRAAKLAGADYAKIQTYTPDSLTIKCAEKYFTINNPDSPWNGMSLYDLYTRGQTPREWHAELFAHAKKIELPLFSSPFSKDDVDFLESLDCPIYKIASFEANNPQFIEYVASKKKPMIISCGILTPSDIERAVEAAKLAPSLTLLYCVSQYPAPSESIYLNEMAKLKQRFPLCKVGFSDHSTSLIIPAAAAALGAQVIEKHIAYDSTSLDGSFALNPLAFKRMTLYLREVEKTLFNKDPFQKIDKTLARSIFIVQDVKEGETFTEENTAIIRPGYGLPPHHYPDIIGKKSKLDLKRGTPLKWDVVSAL